MNGILKDHVRAMLGWAYILSVMLLSVDPPNCADTAHVKKCTTGKTANEATVLGAE